MKLAIAGVLGRMGRMLVNQALAQEGIRLVGGSVAPGSTETGRDIAELAGGKAIGVAAVSDVEALLSGADVVIDFTSPEASVALAEKAAKYKRTLVIGTTGFTPEQMEKIKAAATHTPIVWSANMSLGVNLLSYLTQKVSSILDEQFDIEIVEMHHRHKVDAPSGTALMLGEAAAKGRNAKFDVVKNLSREGITGARASGEIGFATLRGGDVVGDHTVIFAGAGERLELTHKSSSREIYARGAIRAALWTHGKKPGLYSLAEVLGI